MLIGIDLGGTTMKAGLVDFDGNILRQSVRPTKAGRGYNEIINDIAGQIEELSALGGVKTGGIHSIGVGVPGVVDSKTGRVEFCANLSWNNVELGEELFSRLKRKVYVENDATAAGLGEHLFGATKGAENSVLMTLGTGIGSGIIIGGRVYHGSHALGAEIGHMIVGENFYDCNCGNKGCLETFASGTAISKYVRHKIVDGEKSLLTAVGGAEITAEKIFEAAKSGDALSLEAVDRLCKYLAIGIINIYNLLDPDVVALGGGVSKEGDFLLCRVREKVEKMRLIKNKKYGEIVLAALGNKAGIIGSAFLGYYLNSNKQI